MFFKKTKEAFFFGKKIRDYNHCFHFGNLYIHDGLNEHKTPRDYLACCVWCTSDRSGHNTTQGVSTTCSTAVSNQWVSISVWFLLQIISFHLNLPHLKIFLGFSSLISQPGVEKQSNSPYTGTSAVTVKIWKFIALPMAKHSSLLTRPSGNFVHIKNPHPLDRSILIGAIYTAQICMILRATSRRWMSQLTEAILFLQELHYVRWPR